MPEETIWIVTDDHQTSETQRSYRDIVHPRGIEISVNTLEQKMSQFLNSVCKIFTVADQQTASLSGMQLDEIELSVEISGEGEVKLLGTGGKVGSKSAIKLTFKRK